jgi:hypothetical protein
MRILKIVVVITAINFAIRLLTKTVIAAVK